MYNGTRRFLLCNSYLLFVRVLWIVLSVYCSANREPTPERWSPDLMEVGAALHATIAHWAMVAPLVRMGVRNPASDQRERRLGNRAVARIGMKRPNVGPPPLWRSGRRFARDNRPLGNGRVVGANWRLQSGKRPTGATICQPRGSANRDETSERFLEDVALAVGLGPGGVGGEGGEGVGGTVVHAAGADSVRLGAHE